VGVRLPKSHSSLLRHALSDILRAQRGMNYCEFEEATLGVMDAFMECIPGFRGKNLSFHSLLSSNGAHFLPFFADYRGEEDGLLQYRTRSDSFFGINPFDPQLPNYNW